MMLEYGTLYSGLVFCLMLPALGSKCPKCPPGYEPRSCDDYKRWACQPCPVGAYSRHWSRGLCRPCLTCTAGHYPALPCTETSDTLCLPCTVHSRDRRCTHTDTLRPAMPSYLTGKLTLRTGAGSDTGPAYDTTLHARAEAQKGGRGKTTKSVNNVGIYVGIGIGIASLVIFAIIIWCCCKYRDCCSRPPEDEVDDPSKPTYVAMTPITPGEKDHLVFPAVSSSPHHQVVMVSIPNGDCSEQKPHGHGPIDIPSLGLLDDGESIKFIDDSSSDEEFGLRDDSPRTRSLEKDFRHPSCMLTPPSPRYHLQTSSPSLSTRPLLKSDNEQSSDTLDSSLIHSNDSMLTERTPVDDLEPEVVFSDRNRKRGRRSGSPDPFAREVDEDEPLLLIDRSGPHNKDPCNWWDTQSTSSSESSDVQQPQYPQPEGIDHHELVPFLIGSHHHQCPASTEHSLTELERQFDAMISDWEQFQQGNKDSSVSCPYYIYEDQCLETIPESPEFDYEESETSRCSSISALYPWRYPPYVRHPPPPTDSDSETSDDITSNSNSDDDRPPLRFTTTSPPGDGDPTSGAGCSVTNVHDTDDLDCEVRFDEDNECGPGLLMHSPQMEDLRCIGDGVSLSSSGSSLDHVLEITGDDEGHDNHAVLLSSSDDGDDSAPERAASESSLILEQKLAVVRPTSFNDDDVVAFTARGRRPDVDVVGVNARGRRQDVDVMGVNARGRRSERNCARPRSMVEERTNRVVVGDRPRSMVEFGCVSEECEGTRHPVRTTNSSSESTSSSGSADTTSDDSSLIKDEQTAPVVYQNKMYQD